MDRAAALRTVKKWFGRFRNGDFNMDDQPRSGWPSAIDDDIVSALVENNPRITTEEIAERMNIDHSATFCHLRKLGFTSKLDTWVPHSLTERNKLNRVSVAITLLGRHEKRAIFGSNCNRRRKMDLVQQCTAKRKWKKAGEGAEPVAKAGLHPMKGVAVCLVGLQGNYSL